MKDTKIEWCDHTFNPWIGCTKVSPGCANCYAETLNNRMKWVVLGPTGVPQRTSRQNWNEPIRWNREAQKAVTRPRVFCASLADVFDPAVPVEWLADLLDLIRRTPNLNWLLLTKRPENIYSRLTYVMKSDHVADETDDWILYWLSGAAPSNIWIGTTVENQDTADRRIQLLMRIPAAVRFLSCEPLLGCVDLTAIPDGTNGYKYSALTGLYTAGIPDGIFPPIPRKSTIHWVICGGESGPSARPMHPNWARSLRDQCAAAKVPFLFKQWGEWAPAHGEYVVRGKEPMYRVGKKAAGRLLDGVEHNEFPHACVT